MEEPLPIPSALGRARWLPFAVVPLTLLILAATIYRGTLQLRHSIRNEMIGHDGQTLQTAVRMAQIESESDAGLARQMESAAGQLALALKLSRLQEGVLAVRLFDARGQFVAGVPRTAIGTNLMPSDLDRLATLHPVSRFEPTGRLSDFLLFPALPGAPDSQVPLHLVCIPLYSAAQQQLLAAAQFILDGRGMSEEFARLDRALWRQAAFAFLVSGGLLAAALTWAFRRLNQVSRRLAEQTTSLRRANQELALAAKTTALGAVTAHLMHGLASPLNGLQNFVAARAGDDAESTAALLSAQRLQAIVQETVSLLAEEDGNLRYEVPLHEMVQWLQQRVQATAQKSGVTLETRLAVATTLSNHDSHLVALILENLLRNALEATPPGKNVRLTIDPAAPGVLFSVQDQGPGLPEHVRENLFRPCPSTKPGGHGIGLAISRQLARHLGAELEVVQNGPGGCTFALRFPVSHPVSSENAALQQIPSVAS